ncbi:hypothetical protein [Microviridae sp.]|nr:hypothetical protein [Microviridae sp.]
MARRRGNKPGTKRGKKAYRQLDHLRYQIELELREQKLNRIRHLSALTKRRKEILATKIGEPLQERQKAPAASERVRRTQPKKMAPVASTSRNGTANGRKERRTAATASRKAGGTAALHSPNSQSAHCKEKPLSPPGTGGGSPRTSRPFIPWCGAQLGSKRKR